MIKVALQIALTLYSNHDSIINLKRTLFVQPFNSIYKKIKSMKEDIIKFVTFFITNSMILTNSKHFP